MPGYTENPEIGFLESGETRETQRIRMSYNRQRFAASSVDT
jgi:hypothetical protein